MRFWEGRSLEDFSATEWESLCDGCGKCCLHKLETEEDGALHFTAVACRLLDCDSCSCIAYEDRRTHVPDCVSLTPELVRSIAWLPSTCAYRLIDRGSPLPAWHPLICGDPEAVHRGGHSVRGLAVPEEQVDELWDHVIDPSRIHHDDGNGTNG